MMVAFSRRALRELSQILTYLESENPQAAERLVGRIDQLGVTLDQFPNVGRPTDEAGVRYIPLVDLPYGLFFRSKPAGKAEIVGVRHARQRPIAS
jgi:toxin ParE1/3/4